MDGENNGKPYEQMDDLGVFPLFLGWHPYRDSLGTKKYIPASSKWPFDSPNGGHLAPEEVT